MAGRARGTNRPRPPGLPASAETSGPPAAADDATALLTAAHVAAIFLDAALRLRRFTPAVTTLLSVTDADVGRPIAEIARNFSDDLLLEDARRVLAGLAPASAEVRADDGRWYQRRILPCRAAGGRIEGLVVTFADVTELKGLVEALRASDERARDLARFPEDNPNPVLRVSADGTVLYQNRAASEWQGWEVRSGERAAEPIAGLVAQAIAEERQAQTEVALADRTFLVWAIPFAAERHANVYARDITGRKEGEEALRASEEQARAAAEALRAIQEAAPVAIWVASDPACRQITGNAYADEIIMQVARGGNISRSADAGEAAVTYAVFRDGRELRPDELPAQRAAATGRLIEPFEMEMRFPNGRILHLLAGAAPLLDAGGAVRGAVVAGLDISRRTEAEQQLQRTRDMLAEAEKIAHLGSFEYIVATRATAWSEEQYRIFGLDPAAPSPTYDEIFARHIHPDDAARLRETFTACAKAHSVFECEHRIVRPDGSARWVYDRAYPHLDGSGALVRYVGATLDITERKAAEEALRESEVRLRLAQQAAKAGTWEWDLVTNRNTWSDELWALYGLAVRSCEPSFEAWVRSIHPEDREQAARAVQEAAAAGRDLTAEWRVADPEGAERWLLSRGQPQRDAAGRVVRYLGIVLDVTALKQAERDLARDLDVMTRLQRIGTLFVVEGNLRPVLTEIVDAAIAIVGADFGTIQLLDPASGDLRIAAHRGFPQWWIDYWETVSKGQGSCGTALARGERVIVEDVEESPIFAGTPALEVQRRAGVRAVQSTPLISRSGRPLGMFSTHYRTLRRPDDRALRLLDLLARQASDIIDRARAEEDLRRQGAMLTAINRVLALGLGPQTEVQLCEACLGVIEEVTGSGISFVGEIGADGLLHDLAISNPGWAACAMRSPEGHRRVPGSFPVHGIYGRVLADGKSLIANDPASHPDRIGMPEGHPPLTSFLGVPLLREGRTVGMIAVGNRPGGYRAEDREALEAIAVAVVEALDRKRAEEGLARANDQLERRVAERTAQLARHARQLRALAGELPLSEQRERTRLARVLHDNLQQMLVAAKFRTAIVGRGGDQVLRAATKEIEALLDECLAAARSLTAELSPPVLQEAGLGAGLEWLARRMADRHGLLVDLELEQLQQPLPGDLKILLFETVRELLFNVVKHAQTRSAVVSMRRVDGSLQLTVSDQGVGFDPEVLSRAGDPGKGFGLFSVRERLELFGGRLEVQSSPAGGSRIFLLVPLPDAAPVPSAGGGAPVPAQLPVPGPSARPGTGARVRILLADDHAVVRRGLAQMLGDEADFEVVGEAVDGQEAVEMARALLPDVVVMDLSMPRLNGVEATRIICNESPDVRIIGLSMFEDADRAQAMRDAGAAHYMTKSRATEELVAAIREHAARTNPRT
ncbi:MAG TPA: GAF domain-containing protein [bacterium]